MPTGRLSARPGQLDQPRLLVIDNGSTEPETHAYFEELVQDDRIQVLPYHRAVGQVASAMVRMCNARNGEGKSRYAKYA